MNSKFEVTASERGVLKEVTLINRNSEECISIIPELGCRINHITLRKNNSRYSIVREINDPDLISRDDIFNNAKLFPFANRIEKGTYTFNEKTFTLPLNYPEENNAAHGLVYKSSFEYIGNRTDYSGSLLFRYDYPGGIEGYPFRYSILISYILTEEGEVICTTRILNKSDHVMPFNDGWHPFFTLGRNIDELQLSLEADKIIKTNSYGIPNGSAESAIRMNESFQLRGVELDTIFLLKKQRKCTAELYSPADDLTLSLWQDSYGDGYRYLVLYTTDDRKFIAIEPMTSNVNSFNNKEHLVTLAPGKLWEGSFGFKLK